MEVQDSNSDYNDVVDKLLETFGEILSRDIMLTIVESYEGDLDRSANAIINITMEENCVPLTSTGNDMSSANTLNNINMDGNWMTSTKSENYMETNNVFPISTNNQHDNQAGGSQYQMGQINSPNAFGPPMSNSPPVKQPAMSYAKANQTPSKLLNPTLRPTLKSETIKPKPVGKTYRNIEFVSSVTNQKLKTIYKNHENGWRTLIILRGAPGCGKTFLAHKIIDAMYNKTNNNYKMHIFSTDQYFMRGGVYEYCKYQLSEAHLWNQRCAQNAMKQGISPVIIDNTNTEVWEMKPYIESGVNNGYIIEVLESDTPWAKKTKILYNRCSHNVPFVNIQRMLDNYQPNVTGEYLLRCFGYNYKPGMMPPVLRQFPQYSLLPQESGSSTNYKPNDIRNDSVKKGLSNNSNLKQNPHNYKRPLQNSHNNQNNSHTEATKEVLESSSPKSSFPREQIKEDQQKNVFSIPSLLIDSVKDTEENTSAEVPVQNYPVQEDQRNNAFSIPSLLIDSVKDKEENACAEVPIQNDLVQEDQRNNPFSISSLLIDSIEDKEENACAEVLIQNDLVQEDQRNNPFSISSLLIDSIKNKGENACAEVPVLNIPVQEAFSPSETETNLTTREADQLNQQNDDQNTKVLELVEIGWENGEKWEDKTKVKESDPQDAMSSEAKPQRIKKVFKSKSTDNVINGGIHNCEDWSTLCMFLPPWADENKIKNIPDVKSKPIVEKKSSYTCIEIGDTNIGYTKNPHKIISAVSRDINEFHLPLPNFKIPDQWMLHKSTSTHDNLILAPTTRCKNEEQHFEVFVQLFKNTDKSVLRDIFDKCCGDINWAVDIVLDDMASENLNIMDNINTPINDIDVPVFDCECLSAYNVIPERLEAALPEKRISIQKETQSPINLKKAKKETVTSEASIELKRQIEENIVIPDSHYSEHYLKMRKYRRGDVDIQEKMDVETNTNFDLVSSDPTQASKVEDQNIAEVDFYLPSTSKMRNGGADPCYSDLCESPDGDVKTVNVTIGKELILKLNELYGGRTAELLDIIKPTVNIPMFLLNEINALWVESVAHQIEENSKQSELMLEQDEELARQLAFKEEELSLAGKAPEIPDFKEIMDMDFALSLYKKDVEEWRNNLPDDLAAKLTRDKLYNLFPAISSDFLSELLLAHDNNFQSTVEVILTSTGQSDILNTENGVNKFVMEKEMERQEKLLQEEKEALSEVEWPLLPKSDKVDMSVVQKYRDEADKHLKFRNLNFQKAQDYIRRGMTQVGSYFSDVAAFHKMKFEQANSWAAASLMQVHAANATDLFTLDLHFLRVGEAKEAVDLFLDSHIQKLRDLNIRSNQYHSLFFITGRGLHSQGKPRLKPAVKKRLLERGLFCGERNPGLIATRICASNALSHQIA